MKRIIAIVSLIMAVQTNAQVNLDSLWLIWQNESLPDTVRCKAIDDLIWDGYLYSNSDSAVVIAEIFHDFTVSRNLAKQESMALNTLGNCYWVKAEYVRAIEYFERSLSLSDSIQNEAGTASALNNIGGIYSDQGYYPKALYYFARSLQLHEEQLDTQGIAVVTSNIGAIYQQQGDLDKAMTHKQKSLELYEHINDQFGIAIELISIGSIYTSRGDNESALANYLRAIAIREEINARHGLVSTLEMTGSLLTRMGRIDEALIYHKRSLQLAQEIGNKRGYAIGLMEYGTTLLHKGDYTNAIIHCKKAYKLLRDLSILNQQKKACNCLYKTYRLLNQHKEALTYFELEKDLQDSLQLTETAKRLQQMEFEKQLLADSASHYAKRQVMQNHFEKEMIREHNLRNISLISGAFGLILAFGLYRRSRFIRKSNRVLQKERDRSNELLLNILPHEVAEELKEKGESQAKDFDDVTVLFTDFVEFTQTAASLSAKDLVSEINACFKSFDEIIQKHQIEKIKTIGDAYMAAGGLHIPRNSDPADVVKAALEMQAFMLQRKAELSEHSLPYFDMRVGIHTGPVVAGIVGVKKFQYDIWGDTVNTASRMESNGEVGKVNISSDTYELIKTDPVFAFESRGKIEVKGKGEMEMWFVSLKENVNPNTGIQS